MSQRRGWLGPIRPPAIVVRALERGLRSLADALDRAHGWLLAGLACGLISFALAWLIGWSAAALVTAFALPSLVMAATWRDSLPRAFAVIGGCFLARSFLMISLSYHDFEGVAHWFPAGANYWSDEQHPWITTGINHEYDLQTWLPAHVLLTVGMVIFTYTSLGVIPLWQGLYQADLMNVYVGQLLLHSHSPWPIVAVGWHPWSLCRGFGYVILTFEVLSWSLSRLMGTPLSTPERRLRRWCLGLGLLMADGIMKYTITEVVRQTLAANLMN